MGKATTVFIGMGVIYWIIYGIAMAVAFASIAAALGAIFLIFLAVEFIRSPKPSASGWLIFLIGAAILLTAPSCAMYVVLGGHTTLDISVMSKTQLMLTFSCGLWFILDVVWTFGLYGWLAKQNKRKAVQ